MVLLLVWEMIGSGTKALHTFLFFFFLFFFSYSKVIGKRGIAVSVSKFGMGLSK